MPALMIPRTPMQKLIGAGFDESRPINESYMYLFTLSGIYKVTPLAYAVTLGHRDLVQELIEKKGAKIDARESENDLTPLMWAAWYGIFDIARYLIKSGANKSLTCEMSSKKMNAYQLTKNHFYCGPTSFWYSAQKFLFLNCDIEETRELLKLKID